MKIAIDIGHARGTGAVGLTGENEHEIAARIAPLLKEYLQQGYSHTAEIIDFPDESNSVDLARTIAAVNAGGYDLLLSLHCDSSDNAAACGAHACYYSIEGGRLASCVGYSLASLMPGRADKTVHRPGLAILRDTKPVAVLVEMGFVSNLTDSHIQQTYPASVAEKIAQGVRNYIQLIKK